MPLQPSMRRAGILLLEASLLLFLGFFNQFQCLCLPCVKMMEKLGGRSLSKSVAHGTNVTDLSGAMRPSLLRAAMKETLSDLVRP